MGTEVVDLSPLQGMRLEFFLCYGTRVRDLAPLRGMPIAILGVDSTQVTDLSPLKDMPLQILACDFSPERDGPILRSIKTLHSINGKPVAEFWKEVEAQPAG